MGMVWEGPREKAQPQPSQDASASASGPALSRSRGEVLEAGLVPGCSPRTRRQGARLAPWERPLCGCAWILAPPGGAAGAATGRGRRVIYSFAMRVAGLRVFGCLFSGCLGPHALAFHTSPAFYDLSVQPAQGPQRARVPPDPLYAVRTRQTPRWREQPKQSLGGGQLTGGRGGGNGESWKRTELGGQGAQRQRLDPTSSWVQSLMLSTKREACVLGGSPAIGCLLGRQECEQIFQ